MGLHFWVDKIGFAAVLVLLSLLLTGVVPTAVFWRLYTDWIRTSYSPTSKDQNYPLQGSC